jgi:hypothetical protein
MRLNRCRYFRGVFAGVDANGKFKWSARKPMIIDQQAAPRIVSDSEWLVTRLRQRVEMTLKKSGADPRRPVWPTDLEKFKIAANGFCVLAAKQDELKIQLEQREAANTGDKPEELRVQLVRLERAMQRSVNEIARMLR